MRLYLVARTDKIGYDEYDADVIAAENEAEARNLSTVGGYDAATVTLIGTAEPAVLPGIVLASFNAG